MEWMSRWRMRPRRNRLEDGKEQLKGGGGAKGGIHQVFFFAQRMMKFERLVAAFVGDIGSNDIDE